MSNFKKGAFYIINIITMYDFLYYDLSLSSESWVWVHFVNTADTSTWWCSSDSDVTFLTPWGTPRVLDNPVVFAIFSTVTNECNSVVKVSTARCGVEDTWSVWHEMWAAGLDCNGNWLFSDCLKQGSWIVSGNISVTSYISNTFSCVIFACANSSSVWIWSLSHKFEAL